MTSETFVSGAAPGALPLIGHGGPMRSRPVEFFRSLSAHGDLVRIKLGPQTAYVVCHPALLHTVLTDDRLFDKGGVFYDRARDLLGPALGNSMRDEHRRQRRLMQPAFQSARLTEYAGGAHDEADALTAGWHDGQTIDVFPELAGLALRILVRTLFSGRVEENAVAGLQRSTETVLSMLVGRMTAPQFLQKLPTSANRRFTQAHEHLGREVDRLIAECRQSGSTSGDLLSVLVGAREDEGGTMLTDREIRDQIVNLMLAGTENPAATLTWALHLMTENPKAAAELSREADDVLGGRCAEFADLPKLTFTAGFVAETLRLYPPVWMVTRITTAPVELAGTRLPAGATVVFSPLAVHNRQSSITDPDVFDPTRWGSATGASRSAMTSFGGGARRCIADAYSLNEVTLVLATIASRWRPEPAPGNDPRPDAGSGALRPRRLRLSLHRRFAQGEDLAAGQRTTPTSTTH